MTIAEQKEFLVKHNPNQKVEFIGCGMDSDAYKVGEYVYRFPHNHGVAVQYEREAEICNHIKNAISVDTPIIEVVNQSGVVYAKHKMVMGNRWHQNTFAFEYAKQQNLADGLARFFAELHGCKIPHTFQKKIIANNFEYVDIQDITAVISPFLSKWQLRLITRKFNKIRNAKVDKSDMVLCHMGIKCGNAVLDNDGHLVGVFDFGNAGIHERWSDFVLLSTNKNKRLYKMISQRYAEYTGIKFNYARVRDLASIVRFVYKRWFDATGMLNHIPGRRIKRYLSQALTSFMHLPSWFCHIIYWEMTLREHLHKKH